MLKRNVSFVFDYRSFYLFLFLSELRIDIEEPRDDVGQRTGCYDDEEEDLIAYGLLQGTGKESWNHHRQCHEGGTEGIV